jgi:hypothetical protein
MLPNFRKARSLQFRLGHSLNFIVYLLGKIWGSRSGFKSPCRQPKKDFSARHREKKPKIAQNEARPSGRRRFEVLIFLTGAVTLALEVLASRIMTPYFGVSL